MTPEQIHSTLIQLFDDQVTAIAPGSWQVETPDFRLLTLLSEDQAWLRLLIPIASAQEALPFAEQLLEANFDRTQETRYALQEGMLWGVFQHNLAHLNPSDFSAAIQQLVTLHQTGLSACFNQLVETRVRQIIQIARQKGQSLEMTLQMLDRFYQEGIMGDLGDSPQTREETMAAWKYQLERLWEDHE
jgi:hypothetical protein